MSEKVTIFIDGANLFHGLISDLKRTDLDYSKFVDSILNGRQLSRVYYYTALPDQGIDPDKYKKQQGFCTALNKKPYFKVVFGRLEPRKAGYVEKGVDVALAIDLCTLVETFDTAVIVSGDGDFVKAVEFIQRLGKHVEVYSTKSNWSHQLEQTCDIAVVLDQTFLAGCWIK